MNLLHGLAMDFAFRDGNAAKDGDRFFLDPIGKAARLDEFGDLREVPAMAVLVV